MNFSAVDPSPELTPNIGGSTWDLQNIQDKLRARSRTSYTSRYERVFEGAGAVGSAIAGAARTARFRLGHGGSPYDSAPAMGTQCSGMSMAAFLFWIRANCEQDNLEQAIFLARDGELPLRMAEAMPSDYWSGVGLDYLHCGRKSWSVAAASAMGVEKWFELGMADENAFLRHAEKSLSVSRLLDRLGLGAEQASTSEYLSDLDFDAPFPQGEVHRWHSFLEAGTTVELVEIESMKRKALVVGSLRQSGIGSTPMALVDVGWRGQQSWMISSLFREALDVDPLHLHFGGSGISSFIDENIKIRRFAFDGAARPSPMDDVVTCVEMFLGAGQPRLVGYELLENGSIKEVFDKAEVDITTSAIGSLWAGAIALASLLPTWTELEKAGVDGSANLSQEVCQLLTLFWDTPRADESRILQGLRLEVDDAGNIISPVVDPYRVFEFIRGGGPHRHWRSGSLAATPQPTKLMVSLYHALRKAKGLD